MSDIIYLLRCSERLAKLGEDLGYHERYVYYSFREMTSRQIRGYVWYDDESGQVSICFIGSKSLSDVWRDLLFRQDSHHTCVGGVHRGFLRIYRECQSSLREVIDMLQSDRGVSEYHLIGHSMGAALATLFSIEVYQAAPTSLYLFCCPNLGDREFNGWFERQVKPELHNFKIVKNRFDIIGYLPPKIYGYHPLPQKVCWISRPHLNPHITRHLVHDEQHCQYGKESVQK